MTTVSASPSSIFQNSGSLRFHHFFKVSAGHLCLSLRSACKSRHPNISLTTAPRVPSMSV
jgi:hypothetical protein